MGFGPGKVVDAVDGVEGETGGDWGRSSAAGEGEDVESTVAENAEVLGGSDGEEIGVERGELDGVPFKKTASLLNGRSDGDVYPVNRVIF
ncbi:hypothetical protein MLD38_040367 [Melastoma candidum]|uniref:Uncharacterized protein n=1 Tax=Melastoma candidum TaxID=119954 RepID=A0ACB9L5X1_9MYRT|nr:hypothetical protein MLD38_040367 [Melastoma candidum]